MHFFHGYLSQTKFAYFISQTMTVEYTDFAINERNTPRVTQFFTRHYINIVFADINGIERKMRYDRTLWQSFLSFYYLTTVFVVYMVLRLMFDLFSPYVDFYYCVKLTGIKEREREREKGEHRLNWSPGEYYKIQSANRETSGKTGSKDLCQATFPLTSSPSCMRNVSPRLKARVYREIFENNGKERDVLSK